MTRYQVGDFKENRIQRATPSLPYLCLYSKIEIRSLHTAHVELKKSWRSLICNSLSLIRPASCLVFSSACFSPSPKTIAYPCRTSEKSNHRHIGSEGGQRLGMPFSRRPPYTTCNQKKNDAAIPRRPDHIHSVRPSIPYSNKMMKIARCMSAGIHTPENSFDDRIQFGC